MTLIFWGRNWQAHARRRIFLVRCAGVVLVCKVLRCLSTGRVGRFAEGRSHGT